MPAGHELCHADCRFVGFSACCQQLHAIETRRQSRQPRRKFNDRAGQHAGKQMRNRCHLPVDGGDNIRMGMSEQSAHLAGGEIENGAAIRIINETSLGPLDDDLLKGGSVTGQVFIGSVPECRFVVERGEVFSEIVHGSFPKVYLAET